MKFIKIALIASFCIAVFTACSSDTDYCKLQGNDTVGLIKNYDKHNNADILTKTVLEKHLPEMNGNVAFASVEILGEENGKIYTSNVYACYDSSGRLVSRNTELAEFDSTTDKDYRYIDNDDIYADINTFLPDSILQEKQEPAFDWYVYTIGLQTGDIDAQAEEYFSK